MVVAHNFFPSWSWFHFCVGSVNHHHGVAIVGGHTIFDHVHHLVLCKHHCNNS
jgi:hypothetical protein